MDNKADRCPEPGLMRIIFLTLTDLVDSTGPHLPPGFTEGVREQTEWAHWYNLSIQMNVVMLEFLASRPDAEATKGWGPGAHTAIMRARHIARTLREQWDLVPFMDVPNENCNIQPRVPLIVTEEQRAGLEWARAILARDPDAVPPNRRRIVLNAANMRLMSDAASVVSELSGESKRVFRLIANGIRQSADILSKAGMERSNWTRATKPLRKHGLIARKRQGVYDLTDLGWAALATLV